MVSSTKKTHVSDIVGQAIQQERAGAGADVAGDAIKAILARGVTKEERAEMTSMLKNLGGTAHAGLAQKIFNGVAAGANASGLQELTERITGPSPTGTVPSATWSEKIPTAAEQRVWNQVMTDRQLELATVNGHVGRGFHEKAVFSGGATLSVNADLPAEARIPPFWDMDANKPAQLSGAVHLTNGQGCPFKDAGPDVRGLAFKMIDGKGNPWDVDMTNKQTFARDTNEFIDVTKAFTLANKRNNDLIGQLEQGGNIFSELVKDRGAADGTFEAARISAQLAKDTILHKVDSFATEPFTGGEFKTPDGHLAKILLTPVPGAAPKSTRDELKNDDNGLTTEFNKQLESGPVRYRVQLKLYAGNGNELDHTDKWEPSKIIDIGELKIPQPNKTLDAKIQKVVNAARYNPATGFTPAGEMSHARGAQPGKPGHEQYTEKGLYLTSGDNRLGLRDSPELSDLLAQIGSGTVDTALLDKFAAEVDKREAAMTSLAAKWKANNTPLEQRRKDHAELKHQFGLD
jgi:hypothetical protein